MTESISHKVSLIGQAIEDFSFAPLDFQRFGATLEGTPQPAYYKDNGYFTFTNLLPGDYKLIMFGERFQTEKLSVTIPAGPIIFDPARSKLPQLLARLVCSQPGDNELIVVTKTVNGGNKRITFDATTIGRPISGGATVLADGLSTTLSTRLEPGQVNSARFERVAGLAEGSIVRIIREQSIRLRFDSYSAVPPGTTSVVGRITLPNQPDVGLPDALVQITEVNEATVTVSEIAGARVGTADLDNATVVLGTERDLQTVSNRKGDYIIYFRREDVTSLTLRVTLAGFQTLTSTVTVTPQARTRADFELTKI